MATLGDVGKNVDDISIEELEALMSNFDDEVVEGKEELLESDEISDADVLMLETIDELVDAEDAKDAEAKPVAVDDEIGNEIIDALKSMETVDAPNEKADEVLENAADNGPEEVQLEIEESLLSQAIKAISAKEIAEEIYAEQESKDDHVSKDELKVAKAKDGKRDEPKKKREPRKTSFNSSREERLDERARPEFYLLEKKDLELDAEGKLEKRSEVMTMIKNMNVKVGAKCMNFMSAMNGTAKLSTFVESGIRYLQTSEKITSSDLTDYLMDQKRNGIKSYGKGTATPQATNLLKLFTDLRMIEKVGDKYEINPDSVLYESACAMLVGMPLPYQ